MTPALKEVRVTKELGNKVISQTSICHQITNTFKLTVWADSFEMKLSILEKNKLWSFLTLLL